jgi:hypothetical protein
MTFRNSRNTPGFAGGGSELIYSSCFDQEQMAQNELKEVLGRCQHTSSAMATRSPAFGGPGGVGPRSGAAGDDEPWLNSDLDFLSVVVARSSSGADQWPSTWIRVKRLLTAA